MKKVTVATVVSLVAIEGISYFLNAHPSRFDWMGFGWAQFTCAFFSFFLGLLLVFIRATNEIGKGILLGTGIVLIIGWAVCSNSNFR